MSNHRTRKPSASTIARVLKAINTPTSKTHYMTLRLIFPRAVSRQEATRIAKISLTHRAEFKISKVMPTRRPT